MECESLVPSNQTVSRRPRPIPHDSRAEVRLTTPLGLGRAPTTRVSVAFFPCAGVSYGHEKKHVLRLHIIVRVVELPDPPFCPPEAKHPLPPPNTPSLTVALAAENQVMRKLTILMALATTLAASSGCSSCIGRCRNLFHKGSPCGTAMAAPVMGAPLAMGTPMTNAPMVMGGPMMGGPMASGQMCVPQAPMCMPVDQCMDPCADPCSSGMVTMGYGGGFSSDEGCNCAGGGVSTMVPMTMAPGGMLPSPGPDQ